MLFLNGGWVCFSRKFITHNSWGISNCHVWLQCCRSATAQNTKLLICQDGDQSLKSIARHEWGRYTSDYPTSQNDIPDIISYHIHPYSCIYSMINVRVPKTKTVWVFEFDPGNPMTSGWPRLLLCSASGIYLARGPIVGPNNTCAHLCVSGSQRSWDLAIWNPQRIWEN